MSTSSQSRRSARTHRAGSPGPRAAWTPAAVIVALQDWTREWGTPPRREHWTGSHPAAAGAAQRKWTLAPVALDEFAPAVIDDDAARRGALSICSGINRTAPSRVHDRLGGPEHVRLG